jgi:2-dehydropantoate 2-reductase
MERNQTGSFCRLSSFLDRPKKITIIGPGAIGLAWAHALYPFYQVQVVGRKPTSFSTLKVTLEGVKREFEYRAIDDLRVDRGEILLVTVRSTDISELIPKLGLLANDTRLIALMQNGLGVWESATEVFSSLPWVRVINNFGVYFEKLDRESGEYFLVVSGTKKIWVSQEGMFSEFLEIFGPVKGVEFGLFANSFLLEWEKACVNTVINSLCTLKGVRNGAFLEDQDLIKRGIALSKELAAIAVSAGNETTSDAVFSKAVSVAQNTKENINSTLQAFESGDRGELDFQIGAVLKLAKVHGVYVPELLKTMSELERDFGERHAKTK